ncbi:hypothetical protein [Rhizobium sp. FKY42]|uniref:hypothetical protein n=1 Tax=Rhizobium sp. FKY42 TaxID=2562310 RepID=UPI0010C11028|nr:hypothetical protein [Rhizobium sp. FKY42]
MKCVAIATGLFVLFSFGAEAQSLQTGADTTRGADATMAELLAKEYEIKSAVPNGSKLIVFMQKGKSGYACEFVNVANTRCASIN